MTPPKILTVDQVGDMLQYLKAMQSKSIWLNAIHVSWSCDTLIFEDYLVALRSFF